MNHRIASLYLALLLSSGLAVSVECKSGPTGDNLYRGKASVRPIASVPFISGQVHHSWFAIRGGQDTVKDNEEFTEGSEVLEGSKVDVDVNVDVQVASEPDEVVEETATTEEDKDANTPVEDKETTKEQKTVENKSVEADTGTADGAQAGETNETNVSVEAEAEKEAEASVEIGLEAIAELAVEEEVEVEAEASVEAQVETKTEETEVEKKVDDGKSSSLVFSLTKPGDGSDTDPEGIPTRFLTMQKGNRENAKAAFEDTLKWREDNGINTILGDPHPKFDLCKKIFPVYIPGKDVSGHIVFVQRIGLIDFDYAEKNGVTGDDLLHHYMYMIEFCWNIVEPSPTGVMTTVIDLKGVCLKTFRDGNIRGFIKKFVKSMSDNYPQRSHKTLVINAPSWINLVYKLVKPLLRASTRKKIMLLNGGKNQDQVLIDIVGADHIPVELLKDPSLLEGGKEGAESGVHVLSEIEEELRELTISTLEEHNVEMQEPVE